MKKETQFNITTTALFIICSSILIYHYIKASKLKSNFVIHQGKIEYYGYSAGSAGAPAEYSYVLEGVEHIGTFSRTLFCKDPDGRPEPKRIIIPIVYQTDDHSNSQMLLTPSDYKEFNLTYPDSLSPVFYQYFGCEKNQKE